MSTKAQRQYFEEFTLNVVKNVLAHLIRDPVDFERAKELVDVQKLNSLIDVIETELLKRVDFKDVKKVDKFFSSEVFIKVMTATEEVQALATQAIAAIVVEISADLADDTQAADADTQ